MPLIGTAAAQLLWAVRAGRGDRPPLPCRSPATPYTWAEKFESLERINSIRETNGNFDSCNSCKRLGTSRLHELHESKFSFVSRIEFIRSKLSNFSAHVYGVSANRRRYWRKRMPGLQPAARGHSLVSGRRRRCISSCLSPFRHPGYMSRKERSFERKTSMRETYGCYDWCNSCKRLGTSHCSVRCRVKTSVWLTHRFFFRSKLLFFSAHVTGEWWRAWRATCRVKNARRRTRRRDGARLCIDGDFLVWGQSAEQDMGCYGAARFLWQHAIVLLLNRKVYTALWWPVCRYIHTMFLHHFSGVNFVIIWYL